MFILFLDILDMAGLNGHLPDQHLDRFKAAVEASTEGKPGPYITNAVFQRMEREGFDENNPLSEVMAIAQEIGPARAVEALIAAQRKAVA